MTYIHPLRAETSHSLEDLLGAMDDKDRERERERDRERERERTLYCQGNLMLLQMFVPFAGTDIQQPDDAGDFAPE